MSSILRVGFYSELDPGKPEIFQGSIHDAISRSAGKDELKLIEYLEKGIPLVDIMEACLDVISGGKYIPGCSSVLMDDNWIWRLDLPYYVRRYHLRLPNEFIEHALAVSYEIPKISRQKVIDLGRDVTSNVLGMR